MCIDTNEIVNRLKALERRPFIYAASVSILGPKESANMFYRGVTSVPLLPKMSLVIGNHQFAIVSLIWDELYERYEIGFVPLEAVSKPEYVNHLKELAEVGWQTEEEWLSRRT